MSYDTTSNCLHCGAENMMPDDDKWFPVYRCGSAAKPSGRILQTDLCREREAHNKARTLLKEAGDYVLYVADHHPNCKIELGAEETCTCGYSKLIGLLEDSNIWK